MKLFATNIVENFFAPGRYLTIHHALKDDRPWRFAGGKVDLGESPVQASRRELYEEVGVRAVETRFITCVDEPRVDGDHWIGYLFHVTKYSGKAEIREPHKIDALEWLTTAELYQRGSVMEADVVSSMYGFKPNATRLFTPYAATAIEAAILEEMRNVGCIDDEFIAARVGITWNVVRSTLKDLCRKTKAKTKAQLMSWWEKNRIKPVF